MSSAMEKASPESSRNNGAIHPPLMACGPKIPNPFDLMMESFFRVALEEFLPRLMEKIAAAVKDNSPNSEDRLLTAKEAAEIVGLSADWLYRNRKKLPFARKVGPKALRFSHQGIIRWIESRKSCNT